VVDAMIPSGDGFEALGLGGIAHIAAPRDETKTKRTKPDQHLPSRRSDRGEKPNLKKNQKRMIANESGISGRDIGKIEIGNGFSLVEVPESSVDTVIEALAGAKIRGKRVSARRER
jgi:DbpA-like RNA binding protein